MDTISDPFDLARFVHAQDPVFPRVLEELRNGKKQSHWMWYVFPQLRGLGTSEIANRYGISGAEEARAYLGHQILGPRLASVTALMLDHRFDTLKAILGFPDDLKFRSSMTLFAIVTDQDSIYGRALFTFCEGPDPRTMQMLGKGGGS